jgi:aspartyl-tRNA(Asn)/glutamyl-tRNA(Gln) amidotransferase subunit C
MSITRDDVAYIANLARLQPDESQTEQLMNDMNSILEYMNQLNQVDTSNVDPLNHVIDIPPDYRKDIALPPLDHDMALSNAPDADTDYFRVPKVIE